MQEVFVYDEAYLSTLPVNELENLLKKHGYDPVEFDCNNRVGAAVAIELLSNLDE